MSRSAYLKPIKLFMIGWLIIQIALPLRHHFIREDVLWTEEGHRMSWRMMLRAKSSSIQFYIKNEEVDFKRKLNLEAYLTRKQQGALTKPDVFWQFIQRVKERYKGQDIELFANARVRVNNQDLRYLVDPEKELSQLKWDYFGITTGFI